MNNLKKYSKPFMISEQFEPNSYCVICNPKEEVSYILTNPYRSCQFFVLDDNDNGVCDLSDLKHTQTTDNSQPSTTVVNDRPYFCWPIIGEHNHNPKDLSEVRTDVRLWYVVNPGTSSGHVYGYQTMTVIYNHS